MSKCLKYEISYSTLSFDTVFRPERAYTRFITERLVANVGE